MTHVQLLAGGGRRQHQGQAVDIGPAIHLAAEKAELLGRDIGIFAGKLIADHGFLRRVGQFGDAEIDDLRLIDLAILEDDIVGRKVAVEDARLMGDGQRLGRPAPHHAHFIDRQRPLAHDMAERRPVDEFHHQIGAAHLVPEQAVIGNDATVVDPAQRHRLAPEQFDHLGHIRQFRADDLDRMFGAQGVVGGAIDLAHAAPGQESGDPIGMAKHRARRQGRTGPRRGRWGRRAGRRTIVAGHRRRFFVACRCHRSLPVCRPAFPSRSDPGRARPDVGP